MSEYKNVPFYKKSENHYCITICNEDLLNVVDYDFYVTSRELVSDPVVDCVIGSLRNTIEDVLFRKIISTLVTSNMKIKVYEELLK